MGYFLILNQNVFIGARNRDGETVMHIAVGMERLDIVNMLSDTGADPFLAAVDNKSPALHFAARYGIPQIINTLLELGADKSAAKISSETPYEITVRWNRRDNAELLRTR
jgi:ankyrin repeat protein